MPHRALTRPVSRAGVASWWTVFTGGRFYSRWTVACSGIVAVTLLSPFDERVGIGEHAAAMLASLVSWLVLVAVLAPVAVAERRLRSRVWRASLVIGSLVVVTVSRPFLNDALAWVMFGFDSTEHWPQRIATNGFVWFTLLPLVAAAVAWYDDSRRSAARLAAALAVFDDLRERVSRFARSNAALVSETAAILRRRRDGLLEGPIDFDAVRAFADDVRARSHLLDEQLQSPLDQRSGYVLPTRPTRRTGQPVLAQLARPPAALVAAVYFAASAPYTFALGGWPLVLAALAIIVALSAGADIATRLGARGRPPKVRGAVITISWVLVGALTTVFGILLTSGDQVVLLVPLVSIPGLAIVVAFGLGALERTRADSASLTRLLADTSTIVSAETSRAREPLWRAVDILHDRVQGRCVILAARADERELTAEEISRFRADTDAAFDEILAGAPVGGVAADDLDGLLATWSEVLEVRADIDAMAIAALQAPPVAAAVVAVVSEGFVNAVKHSSARSARVSVTTAADEQSVTVRVASHGSLGPTHSSGLGLAAFEDRAQLRQVGDEVLLEVTLPIDAGAAPARPTAASRRAFPPTEPVRIPRPHEGQSSGSLHDNDSM